MHPSITSDLESRMDMSHRIPLAMIRSAVRNTGKTDLRSSKPGKALLNAWVFYKESLAHSGSDKHWLNWRR